MQSEEQDFLDLCQQMDRHHDEWNSPVRDLIQKREMEARELEDPGCIPVRIIRRVNPIDRAIEVVLKKEK